MKRLVVYYFLIIVPFVALIYSGANGFIRGSWFLILLLTYVFIYRSFTDYLRLRSKNVIGKKDFWRILMPGARAKYFKALYFL